MCSIVLLSLLTFLLLGTSAAEKMQPRAISGTNLTAITWAHAVNSKQLLNDTLNSTINYIEADIVLGTLDGDPSNTPMPVMGHPPEKRSDISLKQFLQQIFEFNSKTEDKKGVKLDFKSIEVFTESLGMLNQMWNTLNYPVWINADILKGPVNNTDTIPVNPIQFFDGCKQLKNATLSIGWTTRWGSNFTKGSYEKSHIDEMIKAIETSGISKTTHPITFPVRAGIAAQSLDNLHTLCAAVNKTNNVTLTIWSSANDSVEIDALRKLVFSFGIDRVYLDVPEEVSSQLNLNNVPGRASSLIHFGIVTMIMLMTSVLFSNCQF